MPDPIPVLLLGQLAVDQRYQGRGIAKALVQDALIRSLTISQSVGIAAVLVDTLTDELAVFYAKFGSDPISEREPRTLIVRIKDILSYFTDTRAT